MRGVSFVVQATPVLVKAFYLRQKKGSIPMRNLIRRITTKLSTHEQPEGGRELSHGAIVKMLVCDLSNLDSLTRALTEPRR
jgi:hypothetical protein